MKGKEKKHGEPKVTRKSWSRIRPGPSRRNPDPERGLPRTMCPVGAAQGHLPRRRTDPRGHLPGRRITRKSWWRIRPSPLTRKVIARARLPGRPGGTSRVDQVHSNSLERYGLPGKRATPVSPAGGPSGALSFRGKVSPGEAPVPPGECLCPPGQAPAPPGAVRRRGRYEF